MTLAAASDYFGRSVSISDDLAIVGAHGDDSASGSAYAFCWYEFVYDGVTGAEIDGNVVTLHFVDGDEGDDILTADGMIIDAGGPMLDDVSPESGDYGPGGGCFVTSLSHGGVNGPVAAALALLLALACGNCSWCRFCSWF